MGARLEPYRVFNTVAECGSFSAAASHLFMTQSAVSQAVSTLEKTLGTPLFRRTPKGVVLTPDGQTLYAYTSDALRTLQNGEQRLADRHRLAGGELRIGASDTVSSCYLLPTLKAFHEEHPGVSIRVVNRVTAEAAALVKAGELDLCVGNLPYEDDELDIRPCMTVHDVFVGGQAYQNDDHLYTKEELCRLPLILLENKSNSRRYVDRWFASQGLRPRVEIELGAHELLLHFAEIGLGVSCVIREFSEPWLESGRVAELKTKDSVPPREIGVMVHRQFPLSAAAKAFIAAL